LWDCGVFYDKLGGNLIRRERILRLLKCVLSSTLPSGPSGPTTYLFINHHKTCRDPWCSFKNNFTFESSMDGGGEPLDCWEQMFRGSQERCSKCISPKTHPDLSPVFPWISTSRYNPRTYGICQVKSQTLAI
jgi:hypothetical protein